ncbi:MAG: hypothetical protein R3B84_17455 [Zavarzinella sp.]
MPETHILRTGVSMSCDWLKIHPDYQELLHGWQASDLLQLPGVVVSGHVRRNVTRVEIAGETAYLKQEHFVRKRDRFKNWCDGFGWCSLSVREQNVLAHLQRLGFCAPQWIAYGEAEGKAFLLLKDIGPNIPLAQCDDVSPYMMKLVQYVARLVDSGIDLPDLFLKHFHLLQNGEICCLDWQRARKSPPGAAHLQKIAKKLAQLLVSGLQQKLSITSKLRYFLKFSKLLKLSHLEMRLLYQRTVQCVNSLDHSRYARHKVASTSVNQELLRIRGEYACIRPMYQEIIPHVEDFYNGQNSTFKSLLGNSIVIQRTLNGSSVRKFVATCLGKQWRSQELVVARMLFHLERAGIAAPTLVGYGLQHHSGMRYSSFVCYLPVPEQEGSIAQQAALHLMQQLHAVGVIVQQDNHGKVPFAAGGNRVWITNPACLVFQKNICPKVTIHQLHIVCTAKNVLKDGTA